MNAPNELSLATALRAVLSTRRLPREFALEPGALLWLVEFVWSATGRSSRSGRKRTEQEVAAELKARGLADMTHTRFVAQFGRGKQSARVLNRHLQGIDRRTAKAYLQVAFEQWKPNAPPSEEGALYSPFLLDGESIAETSVDLICDALFGANSSGYTREFIHCRPSPGLTPLDFYIRARERLQSLVVVSPQQPVIVDDVGHDLQAWEYLLDSLIKQPDNQSQQLLHIWAIKEPRVSRSASSLRALAAIEILEMLFKLEVALQSSDATSREFWSRLNRAAVLAVKKNSDNDESRPAPSVGREPAAVGDLDPDAQIAESDVFPTSSRSEWTVEGKTPELGSVGLVGVQIGQPSLPHYSILDSVTTSGDGSTAFVVTDVPSPGADVDKSFDNLATACSQYLAQSLQRDSVLGPHAQQAQRSGWRFYLPREFVNISFPLAS